MDSATVSQSAIKIVPRHALEAMIATFLRLVTMRTARQTCARSSRVDSHHARLRLAMTPRAPKDHAPSTLRAMMLTASRERILVHTPTPTPFRKCVPRANVRASHRASQCISTGTNFSLHLSRTRQRGFPCIPLGPMQPCLHMVYIRRRIRPYLPHPEHTNGEESKTLALHNRTTCPQLLIR